MHGWGNSGANKCTFVNCDETDNLVISVKTNPNDASSSIATVSNRDDFAAQVPIEVMTKDTGADAVLARLEQMNHAEKKPK